MDATDFVLLFLLVALVACLIAWIRARDRLAELEGDDAAHRAHREVRREMHRIGSGNGPLHDPADTKELVLRTAMSKLDADRGLLLGRDDADHDGNLDVICAIGFDRDPESHPFVQKLGERTLERDETLRDANAVAMPVYIADEFDGVLMCAKDDGGFDAYDDDVLLAIGDHAGAVLQTSRLRGELRSAYLATVRSLADAIEAKDPAVRSHSEEVAGYASAVAARLDLDPRRREQLLFGSLLHDVGKIGISERILCKPGRLTDDEFNVIKLHPRIGHRIVAGIPALAGIAPAILHHHERYDGGGYPAGLVGERIPLEARIVGVADSFSAMIADRPYSAGRTPEEACAELERCAGTQFDPEVVRLFVEEVRNHPPTKPPAPDPALDGELAVHRDGDGPLGAPAYALVDGLTLLHSAPYLHQLVAAEARRAAIQDDGFGLVLVEPARLDELNRDAGFAEGDRLLVETGRALRLLEPTTGGTACRLSGRVLALFVRSGVAAAREHVVERLGAGCAVTSVTWEPGESGYDLVARAQRTVNERRATPAGGNVPPG